MPNISCYQKKNAQYGQLEKNIHRISSDITQLSKMQMANSCQGRYKERPIQR